MEQSQKEASDLLEQNRLLQDQLRVALGREQSAREGYVLQVGLRVCLGPRGALRGFSVRGAHCLGVCRGVSRAAWPTQRLWALFSVHWAVCVSPPTVRFWAIGQNVYL